MLKFRIITDSSCGITQEEGKALGVTVLPLTLHYENKDYLDDIDISTNEFYEMLFNSKSKEFPKTSQVPPLVFKKAFEECIENNEIPIVLTIAGSLSGTLQSARIAKDMLERDDIYIIDSNTALGAVKIMIMKLTSTEYETIEDVLIEIKHMVDHVNFYAVPDTLEYLYKGGRLSKTSAILGNILQLKPVIQLSKIGKLVPIAKLRGLKHAFKKIAEQLKEFPIDEKYPVQYGYSTKEENMYMLIDYTKEEVKVDYTKIQISPVVGAHVGPGACAIFYISKILPKK